MFGPSARPATESPPAEGTEEKEEEEWKTAAAGALRPAASGVTVGDGVTVGVVVTAGPGMVAFVV